MLTRHDQKLLRGLSRRKLRESEGLFLAEGIRVVEDLVESPLPVRLLAYASTIEDTDQGRNLLRRAESRGVRTAAVEERDLERWASTQSPQGVIAVAEIPRPALDDLLEPRDRSVVMVLDGVQDPGNLGTLARTAEALGAVGLVALPGTVDAWNPKAVRSAAGSSFRIPILASLWSEIGPWLHDHGFEILAADASGEPLAERPPDRVALVLGNEGAGISNEARIYAERVVAIPLRGRADSLNVAAAAAILLYELLR